MPMRLQPRLAAPAEAHVHERSWRRGDQENRQPGRCATPARLSGTSPPGSRGGRHERRTGDHRPARRRRPLAAAADAFLATARTANPNTHRAHASAVDRVIALLGRDRPLTDVTDTEIGATLTELCGGRAGCSESVLQATLAPPMTRVSRIELGLPVGEALGALAIEIELLQPAFGQRSISGSRGPVSGPDADSGGDGVDDFTARGKRGWRRVCRHQSLAQRSVIC
ncbi:hypothetical protein [Nonomuraea sp. NPDC049646]|uniref:hypothetical protein n=1 Tax=unclassified Nonomuraea TaxID=2593643 RepID=UPI003788C3DB